MRTLLAALVLVTGCSVEDGAIVVEGDRIAAVGRRDEVEVPRRAEVIDVSGKTIIPGLVDVRSSAELGNPELQVRFDRETIARLGLDLAKQLVDRVRRQGDR